MLQTSTLEEAYWINESSRQLDESRSMFFFFFSAISKSFKPCIFHLRFVVSNGHDANRLCTFLCCSTGFTYIRFTFTRTLSLLYCIWVTKAWNCHISKKYRYRLYAFVNYLDRLSEYARVYFLIRRHMNKF